MRLSISTTALLLSCVSLSAQSSHQISAEGGDIVFTPIIHASVQVAVSYTHLTLPTTPYV